MPTKKIKSQTSSVDSFLKTNPDFDILHFDFYEKDSAKKLSLRTKKNPGIVEDLKVHQRLLRIARLCDDNISAEEVSDLATKIKSTGLNSANSIASMPEHQFVRKYAKIFDKKNQTHTTQNVHRAARRIATQTKHAAVNVHGTVASPHFRNMPGSNMGSSLADSIEGIPGYQEIFGSLNYISGDHCTSIFSPAAYFLDLMRITHDYITDKNVSKPEDKIKDGYKLADRRPDLFDLDLTCQNTNQLIPYLHIVNTVLERRTSDELNILTGKVTESDDSSITLQEDASTEDKFYDDMVVRITDGNGNNQTRTITSYKGGTRHARIDKQWDIIPPKGSGYKIAGNIYQTLAGAKYPFNLPFHLPGVQISKYINSLDLDLWEIFTRFNKTPDPDRYPFPSPDSARAYLGLSVEGCADLTTKHTSAADIAPFYGITAGEIPALDKVEFFLEKTGLQWTQLDELFVQGLSKQELKLEIANQFYINRTGEGKDPLKVETITNPDGSRDYIIANNSLLRLDRLSRFTRLARILNWSFPATDTALNSLHGEGKDPWDIDENTIQLLAGIQYLKEKSGFTVEELCALWHKMKTSGRGNGPWPNDLFDSIFNNPALLNGQDPYKSTSDIPFNPGTTLEWTVDHFEGPDAVKRGRLRSALLLNDNDLTRLVKYINGAANPKMELTHESLTVLYRYSKASQFFGLTIDEYLTLIGLLYPAGQPIPLISVEEVLQQKQQVDWFIKSPFSIYEAAYILTGTQGPLFSAPYKTSDLVTLIQNLSPVAESSRLKAESFSFDETGAQDSQRIFDALVKANFLTPSGIVIKSEKVFLNASKNYPFNDKSFESKSISAKESAEIYQDLQLSFPPVLVNPQFTPDLQIRVLYYAYTNGTNLDFIFKGVAGSDNKRNEVRALLTKTKQHIISSEYAFLFPLTEGSFINARLTQEDATRAFDELSTIIPEGFLKPVIIKDGPAAKEGILNFNFDERTDIKFIYVSNGEGQTGICKSYTGGSRTVIVENDWVTPADSSSYYQVINLINQGVPRGIGDRSITLSSDASPVTGQYKGMTIKITGDKGESQVNTIFDYDGGTREAILSMPWEQPTGTVTGYSVYEIPNQGTAVKGGKNQIELAKTASTQDDAYKGMTIEITAYPNAIAKRAAVRQSLLSNREITGYTANVVESSMKLQRDYVQNGLSDFIQYSPEMIRSVLPLILPAAEKGNYPEKFLSPIDSGKVPDGVATLVSNLSRYCLLFNNLGYGPDEIHAVRFMPGVFGYTDSKIDFKTIKKLTGFKTLKSDFNDKDNSLLYYFSLPVDTDSDSAKIKSLSAITHWSAGQISKLITHLWGDPDNKHHFNTVEGISILKKCFDISEKSKIATDGLISLKETGNLAVYKDGKPDRDNWAKYVNQSDILQTAVRSKLPDAAFEKVNSDTESWLVSQKRNGLLGFSLWQLQKKFPEIKKPSDLYQYLLIDVEMSGCDNTSLIAQGIASVQLYMQRCRMMLEKGVEDLSHIPEIWWQWICTYRIWEANRKIYLYPENYLEPGLRKDQSPEFRKFADSLLQTNIDNQSVSAAYKGYFSDFSVLADLVPCGSYSYQETVNTETTETLFIFGRTNKQPYQYFYRTLVNRSVWSGWNKIDLPIDSLYISPVFAFKKLFIFWTQTEVVENSVISETAPPIKPPALSGGEAEPAAPPALSTSVVSVAKATVKFSFLSDQQQWEAPQELASNVVFNYSKQYEIDSYVLMNGVASKFEPQKTFWHLPYPLHVKADSLLKTPSIKLKADGIPLAEERILLHYGFTNFATRLMPIFDGVPATAPDSKRAINLKIFQDQVYYFAKRYNEQITEMNKGNGELATLVNFLKSIDFNISLKRGNVSTSLVNTKKTVPSPDYLGLARDNNTMGICPSSCNNIIFDNYYEDDLSQFPFPATNLVSTPLLGSISGRLSGIMAVKNLPGMYIFDNGDESFLVIQDQPGPGHISDLLKVTYNFPGLPVNDVYLVTQSPGITAIATAKTFTFHRLSTNTVNQMSQKLATGGIDQLLTIESQTTPELVFSRLGPTPSVTGPKEKKVDFKGSYGSYFWESFFHGPFLVASALNMSKRFEESKKWYEYIFNPCKTPVNSEPDLDKPYWQFLPFRKMEKANLVEILTNPAQIAAYHNDPFDPHAIARLRISAYAKTILMRYIDNLLGWGDYLFQQDTRESIGQATTLYVMASDLLGNRPAKVGEFKAPEPRNFNQIYSEYNDKTFAQGKAGAAANNYVFLEEKPETSLENDYYDGMKITLTDKSGISEERTIIRYVAWEKEDEPPYGIDKIYKAFTDTAWSNDYKDDNKLTYRIFVTRIPDFLVRLENTAIAVVPPGTALNTSNTLPPYNEIDTYFSIPENLEFTGYWDKVEDRLFKIRNCMNISGLTRSLDLFAPPIDPRQLIRAAFDSGGLLSGSVLNVNVPRYRFAVIVEKAKSLVSGLMNLGSSLLSALERKDAEALSLLSNSQENRLLNLTSFMKEQQIEESKYLKNSLTENLKNAEQRLSFYDDQITKGLSAEEIKNIQSMYAAIALNTAAGIVRVMSGVASAIPQMGSPFAMTFGGLQLGPALGGTASYLEIGAGIANFIGQLSLTMAGYQRRESEWQLQYDLAGYDKEQINYQIMANDVRQAINQRELEIHKVTISQNLATETMLRTKFTNQELFQWMFTKISNVYFQTYSIAYELALSAQKAYQFELNSNQSFVTTGYWDNLHKGLLSGEGLMLALNQMEKSFLDNNYRVLEIQKTISLLKVNHQALNDLKSKGECSFELPERSFDNDFPGHYCRKIKSISISIPAIVGPYQNIKATLTQLGNQIIIKPSRNAVDFLLGGAKAKRPDASEIRSNWLVNQQVILSKGVNDTGMFELSFNDERYLPFEGTGAVSSWKLSMSKLRNDLDFDSIPDIIIQLNYTAIDGGSVFADEVMKLPAMKNFVGNKIISLATLSTSNWNDFIINCSGRGKPELKFHLQDTEVPSMEGALLTGLYINLELTKNIDAEGKGKYLQLIFPGHPIIESNTDTKGCFLYPFHSKPLLESVKGDWVLRFVNALAPAELLTEDPAIIKDIQLILFYEGQSDRN